MTLSTKRNYEAILIEKEKNCAWLILNRPKVLNALNDQLLTEMLQALEDLEQDTEVKVILITGAGEKSFVAGADIKELEAIDHFKAIPFCAKGQGVFNKIENLNKPVIAVINGFALGGGCELSLACDIRIASEKAKFGQPEINLGIMPGYGGTQRLPRVVGKGRAMELILTGDTIDAQEALRIGLVNRVVPEDKLKEEALVLAEKMAGKSMKILTYAKRSAHLGLNLTIEDGCRLEANIFAQVCATEDKSEGVRAFLEKRKPEFRDR